MKKYYMKKFAKESLKHIKEEVKGNLNGDNLFVLMSQYIMLKGFYGKSVVGELSEHIAENIL